MKKVFKGKRFLLLTIGIVLILALDYYLTRGRYPILDKTVSYPSSSKDMIVATQLSAYPPSTEVISLTVMNNGSRYREITNVSIQFYYKEGRLQLKMMDANSRLTVGVAMALKHGHANGEVEEGLKAIEEAEKEYVEFLEDIAIDQIKK